MIKFVTKNDCMPIISTRYSAGADLFTDEMVVIPPGEVKLVKTGVWIDEVEDDIIGNAYLALFIRSSLALKSSLMLANGTGIIDLDYKDEICVMLYNHSDNPIVINKGDKIAQIILTPHLQQFMNVERVMESREGGFGSTGADFGGQSTADTMSYEL